MFYTREVLSPGLESIFTDIKNRQVHELKIFRYDSLCMRTTVETSQKRHPWSPVWEKHFWMNTTQNILFLFFIIPYIIRYILKCLIWFVVWGEGVSPDIWGGMAKMQHRMTWKDLYSLIQQTFCAPGAWYQDGSSLPPNARREGNFFVKLDGSLSNILSFSAETIL